MRSSSRRSFSERGRKDRHKILAFLAQKRPAGDLKGTACDGDPFLEGTRIASALIASKKARTERPPRGGLSEI